MALPEIKLHSHTNDYARHYFSVVRKPIAGRLLLSRACVLFGFQLQNYVFFLEFAVFQEILANFVGRGRSQEHMFTQH